MRIFKNKARTAIISAVAVLVVLTLVLCILVPFLKAKKAQGMLASGEMNRAAEVLASVSGFPFNNPAGNLIKGSQLSKAYSEIEIGSVVRFGEYEQDNDEDNGKEEIEWIVLDKKDGRVLLISRLAIDTKQYSKYGIISMSWENSFVRKWLNGTFFSEAFSAECQELIASATVENAVNTVYGTDCGGDTQDRVFLLSVEEMEKYSSFAACGATDYAKAKGMTMGADGNCWWWLRTMGRGSDYAACVFTNGTVQPQGSGVTGRGIGIRPAIWVEIG